MTWTDTLAALGVLATLIAVIFSSGPPRMGHQPRRDRYAEAGIKPVPPRGPGAGTPQPRFGRPYPAGPQDASHDHPAYLTAGITGGWLTPNHVRALEGLPPDDGVTTTEEFTR